jgi:hypothetical protein
MVPRPIPGRISILWVVLLIVILILLLISLVRPVIPTGDSFGLGLGLCSSCFCWFHRRSRFLPFTALPSSPLREPDEDLAARSRVRTRRGISPIGDSFAIGALPQGIINAVVEARGRNRTSTEISEVPTVVFQLGCNEGRLPLGWPGQVAHLAPLVESEPVRVDVRPE